MRGLGALQPISSDSSPPRPAGSEGTAWLTRTARRGGRAGDASEVVDRESFLKMAKYPLVNYTDMTAEMRDEAMDISISGIEKFPNNMEKSTQMIKENLDKKFGAPWHVVLGEGFAYDIQFESKHCLNLFIGGTKAILVWKK